MRRSTVRLLPWLAPLALAAGWLAPSTAAASGGLRTQSATRHLCIARVPAEHDYQYTSELAGPRRARARPGVVRAGLGA